MTTAERAEGPWEPAHLVKPARGLIDACPLWDDDGRMYVVHAWAKSRAGFNAVLTVLELSPDGRRVIGEGRTVFEGGTKHPTIEGPKLYKRDGWYWVFAPAGGVAHGWQVAPARDRSTVPTRIGSSRPGTDGRHRSAPGRVGGRPGRLGLVRALPGPGAYGRVVHLQPCAGGRLAGDGRRPTAMGPVSRAAGGHVPCARQAGRVPQTSDELDGPSLGLQWQCSRTRSVGGRSSSARFVCGPCRPRPPGDTLWAAGHLLLQKLPARRRSWPRPSSAPARCARARRPGSS
jgi:hypothetical protein